MSSQRRPRLIAVVAASLLALAAEPAAAASSGAEVPCPSAGVLPVETLKLISPACELTGSVVTGGGVGVHVPPVGHATSVHALGVDGEVELEVRHDQDGRVAGVLTVIGVEQPPAEEASVITQDMVGGQAACADTSYSTAGAKDTDGLRWYYNRTTDPSLGTAAAAYHEQGVLSAVTNLLDGYNDCGLRSGFKATQTYLGDTATRSNISADSTCGGMDGSSVVDWGSINNADYVGLTCRYVVLLDLPGDEEILEADIKIDNAYSYLAAPPTSSCDYSFDVMALMTHEWGHAYGLDHTTGAVADHRQQTMAPVLTPCSTFQRTLGRGDWMAMNAIYGSR